MSTPKRKGRPPHDVPPPTPMPWESEAIAKQVQDILDAMELAPIDDEVRLYFQRSLYRSEMFGGGGREKIILLIRTLLESEGNQDALIEPVVSAVGSCMRPRWIDQGLKWIETFDQIPLTAIVQDMRKLELFREESLSYYLSIILDNKLRKILGPAVLPKAQKPVKPKPAPKPPQSVTRIPQIEKNIALGVKLLALRAQFESNRIYGQQVRAKFDIDAAHAVDCARVAKAFGARPEIYRAVSWITLIELSSPKMSPSIRHAFEAKILAGESVTAREIRRARGPLKGGSPKRRPSAQPARRMAA